MNDARIYVEGGGETTDLKTRCREAITKLLTNAGFAGRLPHVVACGSRDQAYADFTTAVAQRKSGFIALLIDSEDPIADVERTWEHLRLRDGWDQPPNTADDQVFLMTTCMETWIATDRAALRTYYRGCLQETALPATLNMESRGRDVVQSSLIHATRKCKAPYTKDKHSFALFGTLHPTALHILPSFARMRAVLDKKL